MILSKIVITKKLNVINKVPNNKKYCLNIQRFKQHLNTQMSIILENFRRSAHESESVIISTISLFYKNKKDT